MPRVVGTIRNVDGTPYSGAIIKATLSRRLLTSGSIIGNETSTAYSDSYGRFALRLTPNDDGTYYRFRIIKDTVTDYNFVVPDVSDDIDFTLLTPFVPPANGLQSCVSPAKEVQVFSELAEVPTQWVTVPGKITDVRVGGELKEAGVDYVKKSASIVYFFSPVDNEVIEIRYV